MKLEENEILSLGDDIPHLSTKREETINATILDYSEEVLLK